MKTSNKSSQRTRTVAATAAIVFFLSIASVLTILSGCSSTKETRQTSVRPKGTIMRVAHRGGAALAPENTLAAFETGLNYDPDALELDIHLSNDGVLMVMHDPLLSRTTGEAKEISDYDAATLATFNAAKTHKDARLFGFQQIPTLEQVLGYVQTREQSVLLQIEIKLKQDGSRYDQLEEKLIALLRKYDRIDSSVIISFDFPSLQRIHELEPSLQRGALISKKYMTEIGSKGPKAVAENIASLNVDYVGINYNYLSQTLYDEFRAKGLGVGAWTVNEKEAILRMAKLGVDFITSDYPDRLQQLLVD